MKTLEEFASAGVAAQAAVDALLSGPEFRTVPLGELVESPTNPRRHFDPAKMKELAASVRVQGVLVPLLVRERPSSFWRAAAGGHRFEIVAGARRYRAAKAAGVAYVPIRIRPLTDAEVLEIQVLENLQREDLHPLEEAEGYRALTMQAQYDVATIAAVVGKSTSYVYQRLKLAELVEPAQKAFLADEITAGHAILIARLQPKDQAGAMTRVFDVDGYGYMRRARGEGTRTACSVRELAHWIEEEIHLDLHSAPWKKDDATLLPKAGACTTCPKRTGANEALFPDIAKKDTCTDGACFQAKRQAFLDRQRQQLVETVSAARKKGEKVADPVELSTLERYERPRGKGQARGLEKERWHPATKKCPAPITGLVVEGKDLGRGIEVCIRADCKANSDPEHRRYEMSSERSRKAQRAAEKKRAREMERRRNLLRGVLAKAPGRPGDEELRLIGRRYLVEMHRDDLKLLGKLLGVVDQKAKGWPDPAPALRKVFEQAPIAKVTQALLGAALIGGTNISPYGSWQGSPVKELQTLAKRYKAKPIPEPAKGAVQSSAQSQAARAS